MCKNTGYSIEYLKRMKITDFKSLFDTIVKAKKDEREV